MVALQLFRVLVLLFFTVGYYPLLTAQNTVSPLPQLPVAVRESVTSDVQTSNPNKKADFKNFSAVHYPSNTAFLYRETPAEFHHHPEFGTIPYQFYRKDMVELIHKRTEKSRYFVNPDDPNKFTIHQSYGSLHYRDENGWWRTIDPRLRPNEKEVNVYHAPYQHTPTKIDLNKGYTSLTLSNRFELKFNQAVKMYAVYKDGRKELITIINTTPAQTSVGQDGAYSTGIVTGLDREVLFEEGNIKTNFILNQALPSLSHLNGGNVQYIAFEEELSLASGLHIEPDTKATLQNGYISGDLVLKDQTGNTFATWEQPLIYDQAGYLDGLYMIRKEGKKTLLTFAIDAGWLLNDARQYPIVIDPRIRAIRRYESIVKFKNNSGNECWSQYCQEESPNGYQMSANLPPQSKVLTVFFDIAINIDSRIIFSSPVKEANYAFAFSGPCNRSPEDANFYWTCGRRVITNATTTYTCATRDMDGNPILYTMENAGACVEPVCTPSTVDFYLQTTGCNCGATTGCSSDCYWVKPNEWQMYLDGETIQSKVISNAGNNDTTYVCSGDILRYSAEAVFGVPPYKYRWEEKTTGLTSDSSEFVLSGLQEGKMYDLNLYYNDICNDEKVQRYIIFVRKGIEMSYEVIVPNCGSNDGKITSEVVSRDPDFSQTTSSNCPLSKQDEVSIAQTSNLYNATRTPYRGNRFNSRMLFVVRANEIKAANPQIANGGKITSIAFFVTPNRVLSKRAYENFTIKIGTTSSDRLRPQDIYNYKTKTVLAPTDMRVVPGWNVHTFSYGFVWDGTSNLIIDICHNNRFSIQGDDQVELHENDMANGSPLPSGITLFTASSVASDKVMCGNYTPADFSLSTQRPNFKLSFCQGYELLPGNVQNKTGVFDLLSSGTYRVLYVDRTGCSSEHELVLSTADNYELTAIQPACDASKGKISVQFDSENLPFSVLLTFPDQQTLRYLVNEKKWTVEDLPVGPYKLTVTDANGCTINSKWGNDGYFTIKSVPILPVVSDIQADYCGQSAGSAELSYSHDLPPYKLSLVHSDGSVKDTVLKDALKKLTHLKAGFYRLILTDSVGCASEEVTFDVPNQESPTFNVNILEYPACSASLGAMNLRLFNGQFPAMIELTMPDNTVRSFTATNESNDLRALPTGIYKIKIIDNRGCEYLPINDSLLSVHLPIVPLTYRVDVLIPPDCDNRKGIIWVHIEGDAKLPLTGQLTYPDGLKRSVLVTANVMEINDIIRGKYELTLHDADSCSVTADSLWVNPFEIKTDPIPFDDLKKYRINTPYKDTICVDDSSLVGNFYPKGRFQHRWSPKLGLSDDTTESVLFKPVKLHLSDTTYTYVLTILGRDSSCWSGKTAQDTVRIFVWGDGKGGCPPVSRFDLSSPQKSNFTLTPNPANRQITLKGRLPNGKFSIEILDLTGKRVFSQKMNGGSESYDYDISTLTEGVYLFSVKDELENRIWSYHKLVIQP